MHQSVRSFYVFYEYHSFCFPLGVFLVCWLPFFTVNIINAICIRLDRLEYAPDPMLMSLFVWLGYINSFLNPAIYTIFNTEFRKAFKKILQDLCKDR